MNRLEFGAQLRTLRERKGWSQKQLAEKMGTSASVLSQLESGVTNPNLETILKYMEAVDGKITVEGEQTLTWTFAITIKQMGGADSRATNDQVRDALAEFICGSFLDADDKEWLVRSVVEVTV